MQLDHVTAIVDDLERVSALLLDVLGIEPLTEVRVAGMRIRTFRLGGIELHINEPVEPGPAREHLDAHGPALHHIAFRCDDLVRTLERLAARGVRAAGEPVETAPGLLEVFLAPEHAGGLAVQLVERRDTGAIDALKDVGVDALARSVSPEAARGRAERTTEKGGQ